MGEACKWGVVGEFVGIRIVVRIGAAPSGLPQLEACDRGTYISTLQNKTTHLVQHPTLKGDQVALLEHESRQCSTSPFLARALHSGPVNDEVQKAPSSPPWLRIMVPQVPEAGAHGLPGVVCIWTVSWPKRLNSFIRLREL